VGGDAVGRLHAGRDLRHLYAKGWVFLWNFGGVEFALFWFIVSVVVALQARRHERAAPQPLPLKPAAASLGEP